MMYRQRGERTYSMSHDIPVLKSLPPCPPCLPPLVSVTKKRRCGISRFWVPVQLAHCVLIDPGWDAWIMVTAVDLAEEAQETALFRAFCMNSFVSKGIGPRAPCGEC